MGRMNTLKYIAHYLIASNINEFPGAWQAGKNQQ